MVATLSSCSDRQRGLSSAPKYQIDVVTLPAQYKALTSDKAVVVYSGGIGSGKSFTGALWCANAPKGSRILMVAPTYRILRDGTARTLQEVIPWGTWHKTDMTYTLPNGTAVLMRSAVDVDETVRSVHADRVWFDEGAHISRHAINTTMGRMRTSKDPRVLITTNPRKGAPIYDMFVANPSDDTCLVSAKTSENPAISSTVLRILRQQYGPMLAAQELDGEWVDLSGGLWTRDMITVEPLPKPHGIISLIVAVDPPAGGSGGAECGIVVVAKDRHKRGWVLDDASGRYGATEWPEAAVTVARSWEKQLRVAPRIVAEKNQGGDMVQRMIRSVDKTIRYEDATAIKSKAGRASPIAMLYRLGLVSHAGEFHRLVDQMVGWSPNEKDEPDNQKSPDRMDALVWGLSKLDLAATMPELKGPRANPYAVNLPRVYR